MKKINIRSSLASWTERGIIITLLAALMLCVLSGCKGNSCELKFEKVDGGYCLTRCEGSPKSVVIPETYEGEPVVEIGLYAFYNCADMTEVVIPDSVTAISHDAFQDCTKLAKVTIPDSVTYIGSYAFGYCSGLTEITVPGGVTDIDICTFYSCDGLTKVTVSDGVESIGKYAFGFCGALTDIYIPDSMTSIDEEAFVACSVRVHAPHEASYYGKDEYRGAAEWIVE